MEDLVKINRAIISVWNKSGLEEFVPFLYEINPGIEIISSGGTAKRIREIMDRDSVIEVSNYTGHPEMKSGRVKTLHPKIHAGLSADTDNLEDMVYMKEHEYPLIDMVVVNLYPFQKTIRDPEKNIEDAIKNIDIGGPAMLRAGARNYKRVTAIVSAVSYNDIISEMEKNKGALSFGTRFNQARLVFFIIHRYDKEIYDYLSEKVDFRGHPMEEVKDFYLGGGLNGSS